MSRRTTIYNALPIVAQTYGEKFGVQVQLGSHIAHTDGNTIVIPNVPEDYPHMDVIWGYLAHEAAHVRFTDFSVQLNPGIHGFLTNVFEDVRIEKSMRDIYPGTVKTLHEVTRYMIHAGHYENVKDGDMPSNVVANYCNYWLIANVLGQPEMIPFADTAFAALKKTVPPGVVTRLSVLLHKAHKVQSTQDAYDLASQVVRMLQEEKAKEDQKQDQPQPPSDQSQSGMSDQADDKSSDQGSDESSDQASDDDSSQANNGSNAGDDGSTDQPKSGSDQAANTGNGSDDSFSQALAQVLSAGDDQLPDQKASLREELRSASSQNKDSAYATIKVAQEVPNDPAYGSDALKNAKAKSAGIRQQLMGLVQASQRNSSSTQYRGKSLDYTRISRVMTGNMRVFRKPTEKKSPNTAVHILVDNSGSMAGLDSTGSSRLYEVAQEAALTIALALEGLPGVNPAVTYFGVSAAKPNHSAMKHGQRVSSNAGRFNFKPGGSTPMAEGIWYGAYELSKTREQRKLLIVITDGEPDNQPAVLSVANLCQKSDIEIIGIGIRNSSVQRLFDKSIVINNVNDLKSTLFRLMENSLAIAA